MIIITYQKSKDIKRRKTGNQEKLVSKQEWMILWDGKAFRERKL
jgi:hypothetical protein